MKKKDIDWAAAGLDRVGGDRPRVRPQTPAWPNAKYLAALHESEAGKDYKLVPAKDLKHLYKALEEAHAALHEKPEFPMEKFAELVDVRIEILEFRRKYYHNVLRAFAGGVLVAWIAWTIFGGPS